MERIDVLESKYNEIKSQNKIDKTDIIDTISAIEIPDVSDEIQSVKDSLSTIKAQNTRLSQKV